MAKTSAVGPTNLEYKRAFAKAKAKGKAKRRRKGRKTAKSKGQGKEKSTGKMLKMKLKTKLSGKPKTASTAVAAPETVSTDSPADMPPPVKLDLLPGRTLAQNRNRVHCNAQKGAKAFWLKRG